MMTLDEFGEGLDRYGAELARWPAPHRAQAEALLRADGEAARLLAEAGAVAATLAQAMRPLPLDAAAAGRIVAAALGQETAAAASGLPAGGRLAALAALALVIALGLGFLAGSLAPAEDDEDTVAVLVFGGDTDQNGDQL
jgi:hypothetical protein